MPIYKWEFDEYNFITRDKKDLTRSLTYLDNDEVVMFVNIKFINIKTNISKTILFSINFTNRFKMCYDNDIPKDFIDYINDIINNDKKSSSHYQLIDLIMNKSNNWRGLGGHIIDYNRDRLIENNSENLLYLKFENELMLNSIYKDLHNDYIIINYNNESFKIDLIKGLIQFKDSQIQFEPINHLWGFLMTRKFNDNDSKFYKLLNILINNKINNNMMKYNTKDNIITYLGEVNKELDNY